MSTLMSLRVDHLERPLAIPSVSPLFSWQIQSEARGVVQSGYEIVVVATSGARAGEEVWNSGLVQHNGTEDIRYSGTVLPTATRFEWTLRSHLGDGSSITEISHFETGPSGAEWDQARWIGRVRPAANPMEYHPAPYLRGSFLVDGTVARARVFVTAGGLFDLWCNGQRVSQGDLAPGWTDYRYRVPYHAFDLTPHLKDGENVVGAVLGEGWFSGYTGPFGKRGVWGERPIFRALCRIEYTDGRVQTVGTDSRWECSTGPILLAELLHGFRYDRRLEIPGWSAQFGDWDPVETSGGPAGKLVPAKISAAGQCREISPVTITRTSTGSQLIDFGQNFAGRVRLALQGSAGTIVRLRHAELLDNHGRLYVENLRTAAATDEVILAGTGVETFEPIFTYHGFRYVEIDGAPTPLEVGDVTGIVVSSLTGTSLRLRTDSDLVNRLQENLEWTMLSNFIEVPTDCPNRDERLGWAGDAQMFAPVAMYNGDTHAFFGKWLDDISDAQKPSGAFADIAPGGLVDFAEEGAAGYADAGVFLPWDLYVHYGDLECLENQYDGVNAWLRYIASANPDYIWRHARNADYGDWLSTQPSDKALTATAYWANAARIAARYADVLGLKDDRDEYTALFMRISSAFRSEFLGDDGKLAGASQTALALAIMFDLLEPEQARLACEQLAHDVESRGYITVGFQGIRFIYPALERAGRPDLALRSLLRTERPSLGDQVARGLTTIGEHWSAWQESGELVDASMNSFNHFALASVFEWVYHAVGGVAPLEPAFAVMKVAPVTDSLLGKSSMSFASPRGPVSCEWERTGEETRLKLTIPANTTAIVDLPGTRVTEAGVDIDSVRGVASVERQAFVTRVVIGSGSYDFRSSKGNA